MDDMNAFERQVAGEVIRAAAPARPVDAAAVFAAIPATPSPKWRLQSMFSATKFVAAGAIVALFGGFLLAGVMTTQPTGDSAPAAAVSPSVAQDEADPMAAAWVTGTITWAPTCEDATTATEGGVRQERGHRCEPRTVTSDDPRLSGTSVVVWNKDVHSSGNIRSQTEDIRGDGRGWVCHTPAVLDNSAGFFARSIQGSLLYTCTGDGDNAGLMALLALAETSGQDEFEGLIFPGELPPVPDPSAAE